MSMGSVRVSYSDETRLGQGVNSFTLQPCLAKRVEASLIDQSDSSVHYEFKVVHRLSEIASCLGVSYHSCIKRRSLSLENAVSVVDETTFNSADINILIAVRVVSSERYMQADELKMQLGGGIQPGTHLFNETYGDSYYSGIVEGGIAVVVLSIAVLDRHKVKETVDALEHLLDLKNDENPVKSMLEAYREGSSNPLALALKGTETHASVSRSGNGYLKIDSESDSIERMLEAVLEFPKTVIKGAGWAWVNVTRYQSNPRFQESLGSSKYAMLDYTLIQDFAATLSDDFMSYSCLLKDLQVVMDEMSSTGLRDGDNTPADLPLEKLLNARRGIQEEMTKIVEAIDAISRDPWILVRQKWKKDHEGPTRSTNMKVSTPTQAVGTNGVRPYGDVNDSLEPSYGIEQLAFDFDRLQPPDAWKVLIPANKFKTAFNTKNKITVTKSLDAVRREYQQRINDAFSEYSDQLEKQRMKFEGERDRFKTNLEAAEKVKSELMLERDNFKKIAEPQFDSNNNLGAGWNQREVAIVNMASMDGGYSGICVDGGDANGSRVHGYSYDYINNWHKFKLIKVDPKNPISRWWIRGPGEDKWLWVQDGGTEIRNEGPVTSISGSYQWTIEKVSNGRGYRIANAGGGHIDLENPTYHVNDKAIRVMPRVEGSANQIWALYAI
ncbi:hypothetical protein HG530_004065 [Fusarium avenaceum]|nr:hypothetical protein HG530_004065 [Fusarium avenaceum]